MGEAFWDAIRDAGYAVPPDHSLAELTGRLLACASTADASLRERAADVLGTWIGRGAYDAAGLRAISLRLAVDLTVGLGEPGGDGVLARAFSVGLLARVLGYEREHPFLEAAEVREWLRLVLAYLAAERDLRACVPGRGRAQALAGLGELLACLCASGHLGEAELERVLSAIADKVLSPLNPVLAGLEDESLAAAAATALRRGLVGERFLGAWVRRLASPPVHAAWAGAWEHSGRAAAFANTRSFLRALYLRLDGGDPPAGAAGLRVLLVGALATMEAAYRRRP